MHKLCFTTPDRPHSIMQFKNHQATTTQHDASWHSNSLLNNQATTTLHDASWHSKFSIQPSSINITLTPASSPSSSHQTPLQTQKDYNPNTQTLQPLQTKAQHRIQMRYLKISKMHTPKLVFASIRGNCESIPHIYTSCGNCK